MVIIDEEPKCHCPQAGCRGECKGNSINYQPFEYVALRAELEKVKKENGELRQALELIACPLRPDGTYNRDRKACELIAKEVLEGMK